MAFTHHSCAAIGRFRGFTSDGPSDRGRPQKSRAQFEILEQRQLLSAIWFVSPSGSNNNPGTYVAPFQTIQHAASVANSGDAVDIETGTYREQVTPAHSGVAFQAYEGESVTISGADPISGWTPYSGDVYQVPMSWDLDEGNNEVFVNGSAINEAVFPNSGVGDFSNPTTLSMQKVKLIGDDAAVIYNSALNQSANSWTGAIINMNPGQAWEHQTGTVTSSSPGSVTISFVYHSDQILPTAGNTFYLFGKFQALDSAGEWYRDPTTGKLFAWMPDGGDPSSEDIEVKRRTYAFNLNNVNDTTIEGINLFAASIVTSSKSYGTVVNGVTSLYANQNLQIPQGWYISPVGQGIALMGDNSVVENSAVAFTSGEGIAIEGADCVVENNVVHDADYTGANIGAITLYADGDTVEHNTIYNSGRDGIKASVAHVAVTYNLVHDVGLQTNGAGGIYTANTDGEGSVMAYNDVYNIHSGGDGGTALFANTNTSGWSIHNNLTYNVDFGFTLNDTSNDDFVYNNTLQATEKSVNTDRAGNWDGTEIYNNIYTAPAIYTTGATVYNNASSLAAANSSQGAGNFTAGATGVPFAGNVSGSVTTSAGAPIVGVTIYVDIDNSNTFDAGDPFAITNSTGAYTIANVPAGVEFIRQVLPTGDTQTNPGGGDGIPVNIPAGGSLSHETFVDAVPTTGSVSGSVTTSTGSGVPNITIFLDDNNNSTLDAGEVSTTTDSSGNFRFNNVAPGALIVRQILPPGDTQTSPTGGGGIPVIVTAGGALSNANFIDALPTTGNVSGLVTTGDATPIAGVTVYVDIDDSNTFNAGDPSAVTDSTGAYTIANVPAGTQTIDQVLPFGDTQTSPIGGGGIPVTVIAGGSLSNENFVDALAIAGTVSGAVTTGDGAPIAGVTVFVDIDDSDSFDAGDLSTTTDSNGDYTIDNVPPGADHRPGSAVGRHPDQPQ